MFPRWVEFDRHGDSRGSLVSVETAGRDIPFPVERVYFIYGTQPGVSRGFHAHKRLQQIILAVAGSCDLVLDDGREHISVVLNDPTKGVWVEEMVWREMHNFSPDCVLLVFASLPFDESDYVRDHVEFLELVQR